MALLENARKSALGTTPLKVKTVFWEGGTLFSLRKLDFCSKLEQYAHFFFRKSKVPRTHMFVGPKPIKLHLHFSNLSKSKIPSSAIMARDWRNLD